MASGYFTVFCKVYEVFYCNTHSVSGFSSAANGKHVAMTASPDPPRFEERGGSGTTFPYARQTHDSVDKPIERRNQYVQHQICRYDNDKDNIQIAWLNGRIEFYKISANLLDRVIEAPSRSCHQ